MNPGKNGNLRVWLEQAAGDEAIEAVSIGNAWGEPNPYAGRLLSWEDAGPLLDVDFDDVIGCAGCPPVTAWTATRVLFVHEYDGATGLRSLPRNPSAAHRPEFDGTGEP